MRSMRVDASSRSSWPSTRSWERSWTQVLVVRTPAETQLLDLELSALSRRASGELYRHGGRLLGLSPGAQARLQIEAWVRRQFVGA